jgi:hypothetical protein
MLIGLLFGLLGILADSASLCGFPETFAFYRHEEQPALENGTASLASSAFPVFCVLTSDI